MKHMDGYKIVVHCGMPKRRETLKGATTLADKLHRQGRHGEIQETWVTDNGIKFVTIKTF